jgi:hypothetical protein
MLGNEKFDRGEILKAHLKGTGGVRNALLFLLTIIRLLIILYHALYQARHIFGTPPDYLGIGESSAEAENMHSHHHAECKGREKHGHSRRKAFSSGRFWQTTYRCSKGAGGGIKNLFILIFHKN